MPICRTVHDTEAAILATAEQSYVLHDVVMRKQVVADPGRVVRLRVFLSVVSPTPTYSYGRQQLKCRKSFHVLQSLLLLKVFHRILILIRHTFLTGTKHSETNTIIYRKS